MDVATKDRYGLIRTAAQSRLMHCNESLVYQCIRRLQNNNHASSFNSLIGRYEKLRENE
jgi:hypothetical protein